MGAPARQAEFRRGSSRTFRPRLSAPGRVRTAVRSIRSSKTTGADTVSGESAAARRRFGETSRRDAWWLQPALVFAALTGFIAYATWAGMQGKFYFSDAGGAHYLSPFYS